MALIDKTYFTGELDIPDTGNANVEARLNSFINKYEPKFLTLLLGAALYGDYKTAKAAATEEAPLAAIWTDLEALVKSLLAGYVYYWYMRDAATKTTGVGEVKPAVENGAVVDSMAKQVRAWNEMAEGIRDLYDMLDAGAYASWTSTYRFGYNDSFGRWHRNGLVIPINTFNI